MVHRQGLVTKVGVFSHDGLQPLSRLQKRSEDRRKAPQNQHWRSCESSK
jgi:hypothetical protein